MLLLQYPDREGNRQDVRREHWQNTVVLLIKVRKESQEAWPRPKEVQVDEGEINPTTF